MGNFVSNCITQVLSSAAVVDPASTRPPPGATAATTTTQPPPSKKQRKEQPYVTEDVVQYRAQAQTYHANVVTCAQQSQQAYQRGDKETAHTLSKEKKHWQQKQEAANEQAATVILQLQHWKRDGTLDLHGLYLEEAMKATRTFLDYWGTNQRRTKQSQDGGTRNNTVLIITGAGHHSNNSRAVLRPKVEELLQQEQYTYKSVHGDGAFEVTIKPSQ